MDDLVELDRLVFGMVRHLKGLAESMKKRRRYRDAQRLRHAAAALSDSFRSFEYGVKSGSLQDLLIGFGDLYAALAELLIYAYDYDPNTVTEFREKARKLALQIMLRRTFQVLGR